MHERLRAARQLAKISQRELARLAEISAAHVSAIESGRIARPNAETLSRLCVPLGITLEYVVTGKGRSPTEKSVRAAVERRRGEIAEVAA